MIDWDGNKILFMLENAPSIDPTVESALKSGEYTFIDYTDINRYPPPATRAGSNFGKLLLVGGLLVVGLVLIVRR
jgi:hypothetical protein